MDSSLKSYIIMDYIIVAKKIIIINVKTTYIFFRKIFNIKIVKEYM